MVRSALLLSVALVCGACIPPDTGYMLGVPYRAQDRFNYCTPASVLMWRLYDGLPEISQTTIFNWMGGQGCTNQLRVRDAVNNFTATHDVYWDNARSTEYRSMAARQATSIDQGIPVIVVVRFNHTGVLNGGKWHEDNVWDVWDFVYFHDPDPAYGANFRWVAGDWLDQFCPSNQTFCDQIISGSATAAWESNLQVYGGSVQVYGGSRGSIGPPEL